MTNVNLNINVTQTGARTVRRQLQDILDTANQATRTLRLFQNALFVLGAAGLVRRFQQSVDLLTNFENRIRLVTRTTDELNQVQTALFDISERTRSSFEGTAEVYTRTALSVRELGVSQQEVLNFTESLNQAVILSGASAREANAALIQLGQGLASNRLSGDELRSVLEQLPFVADIIAKSLNITRGELRQFGRDGKLSAGVVLKAFRDAREEIAGKFAETVPTLGQAFSVLETQFLRVIDSFDDFTNASAGVSRAIILLASNLETLIRLLGVAVILGFTEGILFAGRAVGALTIAVGFLTRALVALDVFIQASPFRALAIGLRIATALLLLFGDRINVTTDGITKFSDLAVSAFQLITEALTPLATELADEFSGTIEFISGLWSLFSDSVSKAIGVIPSVIKTNLNVAIGLFVGSVNSIIATWELLPAAIRDVGNIAFNGLLTIVEKAINAIINAIQKLFSFIDSLAAQVNLGPIFGDVLNGVKLDLGQFKGEITGAAREVAGDFSQEFKDALGRDFVGQGLDAVLQRARERAIGRGFQTTIEGGEGSGRGAGGGADGAKLQQFVDRIRDENALLRVNFEERDRLKAVLDAERKIKRDLTEQERALIIGLTNENILLKDQSKIYEELREPANTYERSVRAITQLFADSRITVDEFNKKLRETRITFLESQTDAASGIERSLLNFVDGASDFASQFETVFNDAFKGIEDVFVNFVKTGKFSFKDLADSILADLARIVARTVIIKPIIQALGGFFGGGSSGALAGIPGFATGGSITVGGSGGIDSQLVVARATPGERIDFTPPGQQSSNGGSTQVIVNNFSGQPVQQNRRKGSGGTDIVEVMIGKMNEAMGSGRFDNTMRGRFAVSPNVVSR